MQSNFELTKNIKINHFIFPLTSFLQKEHLGAKMMKRYNYKYYNGMYGQAKVMFKMYLSEVHDMI